MIKVITVFLFLFNIAYVLTQEQNAVFEHYSAESILSSALIKGMMQDKEGYLWFGTLNAIHRFDGLNFKTFAYEPDKIKSFTVRGYVTVIYEDSKGDIWIGTQGGMSKMKRETGEFKHYYSDNQENHKFSFDIQSVYEDLNGRIWIGTMMGLYYVDSTDTKLLLYNPPKYKDFISNITFKPIVEDDLGNIWFGTGIGLLKLDKKTNDIKQVWGDRNTFLLTTKNTVDFAVQSIYKDSNGIFWAGSLGGAFLKINTNNGEIETDTLIDNKTLEKYPIQSICNEDDNNLWIATYNGLLLVEKNSHAILEHYVYNENIKESLNDNKLTKVLKDRSGALWVGSLTGGLNKLNRTKIPFKKIIRKSWAIERTISQTPFTDMICSRNGSILAGTDKGIEVLKTGQADTVLLKPNLSINALMEDKNGNLWIGIKQYSGGGLYKRDVQGNLISIRDTTGLLSNREVQCFIEMSDGRIFFSSEFNLFEINTSQNSVNQIFQVKGRIYKMCEDINNILCIGTFGGGLVLFDPVNKTVIRNFMPDANDTNSISDISVTDVFLDTKGRLWVGTTKGLSRFDRETGSFKLYNNKYGLAHNLVYKILEDNSENLWLGTGRGISKFYPETEVFKNYDVSYGLLDGPQYIGSKSASGEMYFKSRTGISYFYPDSIKDNPYIPPIVITDLKVHNNPYPLSREINLSYTENYISFEFSALNFVSPEKNMYAYKMEGVDKDWVYSGSRRYVSYSSLDPGNYVFHVKGSNNDGLWNNEGTTLNITILPPWYKTFWAFALYLIFILFGFYLWRKYDLKRQNLKYELQLEHENAQRQEELSQMKSRFFTNISHEFKTPLTLIIGPAENIISSARDNELLKNAGLVKKNAIHLLGLVNQLLDISRLDEGRLKLNVSYGNIVTFVKGVAMIFESFAENKDILMRVKSETENIEGYFDKEKIEKILINIISNALKFTPEGGKIYINIEGTSDSKVFIKIKDTGIGINKDELPKLFDRFYQVDSSHTREQGGTGIGLALTKELVELHRGIINVDSSEGRWTEFSIELPVGREYFKTNEITETKEELKTDYIYTALQEQLDAGKNKPVISFDNKDNDKFDDNGDERFILLIVEDNEDVRQYLRDTLEKDYIIEEANNGEQGFRKAEAIIPDLIIGDIMMPKMDGMEMTKKLRQDEKTNHIPVILLTAKSDQRSRLEGLESGADAYLTKPFDTNELKIRIINLINIRKNLQAKFTSREHLPVKNGEKKLSDMNEKFINKVIEVMKKHINEEEFSIEDFGRELFMSRTQLHRKLKALTGKSASRYMRSFRLTEAKKMIEEGKGTISEIAYNVGFSSPIYFSKCFKDEFGYPPSEHFIY